MEFTAAILPASLVFIILSLDLIYWEAVAGADICVCRRSMPDLGQPGMLAAINPGERLPESHVTTQPAGSDDPAPGTSILPRPGDRLTCPRGDHPSTPEYKLPRSLGCRPGAAILEHGAGLVDDAASALALR